MMHIIVIININKVLVLVVKDIGVVDGLDKAHKGGSGGVLKLLAG